MRPSTASRRAPSACQWSPAASVDGAQSAGKRRHRPAELAELGFEHGVDGLAAVSRWSPRPFGAKACSSA
jgi:hypothetical protein